MAAFNVLMFCNAVVDGAKVAAIVMILEDIDTLKVLLLSGDDHVTSKTSLKGLQSVKHHLANESLRMTSFLVAGLDVNVYA